MSFRMGFEGKLYYKIGGVAGGGAWTELTNARDVNFNCESSEVDVTTRGSGGYHLTAAGLKTVTVEWEMVWDPDDAGFNAFRDAWLNRQIIGIRCLDNTEASGGQGPQFDAMVPKFGRTEALDGAMLASVSVKPTYSATPPSWVG